MQIDKDIPLPTKFPAGWKNRGLPFDKLEVGDSFLVEKGDRKSWAFAFDAIKKAQQAHDIKLTTRLESDGKRRIWRVA